MKKILITLIIMSICLLSACRQEDISSEKNNKEDETEENSNAIQSNVLLPGEAYKDKDKIVTMHTAYSEMIGSSDDPDNNFSISAIITVENVSSETPLNVTTLSYRLNEEDNTYQGEILSDKNPSDTNLAPGDKITLNITFKVPLIQDKYMFEVDSFDSPSVTPWLINDLDKFN